MPEHKQQKNNSYQIQKTSVPRQGGPTQCKIQGHRAQVALGKKPADLYIFFFCLFYFSFSFFVVCQEKTKYIITLPKNAWCLCIKMSKFQLNHLQSSNHS